jgi:hypothetical protein
MLPEPDTFKSWSNNFSENKPNCKDFLNVPEATLDRKRRRKEAADIKGWRDTKESPVMNDPPVA